MGKVWPARLNLGKFFWCVVAANNKNGPTLAHGYTDTEEQALRNARKFMKNNQNAVYG